MSNYDSVVIEKLGSIGLFRVSCCGVGLIVPHWRISEALIHRVVRMAQEVYGVGI